MGKRSQLSIEEKTRILCWRAAGVTAKEMGERLGRNAMTMDQGDGHGLLWEAGQLHAQEAADGDWGQGGDDKILKIQKSMFFYKK